MAIPPTNVSGMLRERADRGGAEGLHHEEGQAIAFRPMNGRTSTPDRAANVEPMIHGGAPDPRPGSWPASPAGPGRRRRRASRCPCGSSGRVRTGRATATTRDHRHDQLGVGDVDAADRGTSRRPGQELRDADRVAAVLDRRRGPARSGSARSSPTIFHATLC